MAIKQIDTELNLSLFDDAVEVQPLYLQEIKECLKHVSLKVDVPDLKTTGYQYFLTFLKNKETSIDTFFKVDEFSGRLHTPLTRVESVIRDYILLDNDETESVDVSIMQPLLLGKILSKEIGSNEYSDWINNGKDIYLLLKDRLLLQDRNKAKSKFFEIIFSPPSSDLEKIFGKTKWIEWINNYKKKRIPENPHSKKNHSNLAWLLQKTEVEIMTKIWKLLIEQKIIFLTLHDEVVCKKSDLQRVEYLFKQVLDKEFDFYEINNKLQKLIVESKIEKSNVKYERNDEIEWIEKEEQILEIESKEDWSKEIDEINEYIKSFGVISNTIKLSEDAIITDVNKFTTSHYLTLKTNNGNENFSCYLERYRMVKKILENYAKIINK